MAESAVQRSRAWAIASVILGAAMLAVYLGIMMSEGNNTFVYVLPWALLMSIAPALALASVVVLDLRMARNLLIGAAALFGVLGVVSVFTIGVGFLIAAALAAVGAARL
jgi:hypothetical protein